LEFCEGLAEVMFKFTKLVMYFAPVGVGAAIAYTVGHMGLGILVNLFKLLATLYVALIAFLLLVLLPVALLARVPLRRFVRRSPSRCRSRSRPRAPSGVAARDAADGGIRGASQDRRLRHATGTASISTARRSTWLASIFVAQAAGFTSRSVHQIAIVFTLMLTSKGVAGVPRATLVILLGTRRRSGCRVADLAIIGIDELMDMARTSVNVIATVSPRGVARLEGSSRSAGPP